MLVTTPLARVAIVLVLTAAMAALMIVRVGGESRPPAASSISPVSLARHTPGSAAHERHEYRVRLTAAASSSTG